jgi:transcriptional regulator with XRE-family HTH domain
VRFNRQLMAEDLAIKGWTKAEFSKRARVADMTVIRFLRGDRQTAQTAHRLAKALGHSVKRYLIPHSERRAS